MESSRKECLMKSMAANLPTLRAKAGLTQAKLAEIIGVSRQTVVAVESGKRVMSWNTYLGCVLVFQKNEETKQLLELYEITTNDFNAFLGGET